MSNDLTTRLSRELHEQVDGWHDAPLTLDSVRGRALSIRRTRRLVAAGTVAAAVGALAVPTVMVSAGLDGRSDREPAPVDTPTEVVRTELTLDGLPRGAAPTVEYFTPEGVVLPDEGLLELPQSYNAMVPSEADGGWIAWEGPSLDVRYLSEDLRPQGGSTTNNAFVTNPDRTAAAWTFPESGAQTLVLRSTLDAEGTLTWDFPDVSTGVVDPVDFLSGSSLLVETAKPNGRTEIAVAEADGSMTPLPGYVDAISGSPVTGLAAVQTRSNEDASGCFGVVDTASPEAPVWESCDHSLGAFSPDGRYVLASDPYLSGAGIGSVKVLDAMTGDEVARFEPERRSELLLQRLVWEDEDSFVAVAAEAGDVTMLRFGVDGSLEEVTDRLRGDVFGDLPLYLGGDRVRGF